MGFTHICGKKRNGEFQIVRQTIRKRMRMKLKSIRKELRLRLHDSIVETGRWLCRVVKGCYRYYGVSLNSHALGRFYYVVCKAWLQILNRRSQKSRITWIRMRKIAKRWFPIPLKKDFEKIKLLTHRKKSATFGIYFFEMWCNLCDSSELGGIF